MPTEPRDGTDIGIHDHGAHGRRAHRRGVMEERRRDAVTIAGSRIVTRPDDLAHAAR